jgi:hypothetical protein
MNVETCTYYKSNKLKLTLRIYPARTLAHNQSPDVHWEVQHNLHKIRSIMYLRGVCLEHLTRGLPDGKSTLSLVGSNLATLSGPTMTPGRSRKLAP